MTAGCRSTRTSCAGAAEFIRARTLRDLPRTHGPMLPGAAVQTANGALSRVEQTKRFAILPVSWEPGGDQVTPTIKLKRQAIAGPIRPTSSGPCTPEPARRRTPAELTPVAMPVPRAQAEPPAAGSRPYSASQLA